MVGYRKLARYKFSTEMTVLGGLPVRVMFAAHDDGEPDGWMVDAITGYCSVKTGKPLGKWVERRVNEAGEEDKVYMAILESEWSDETYIPEEYDTR